MGISGTGRTTSLLGSQKLLAALQRTQRELQDAQNEISTGIAVNRPSEAPSQISAILTLQSGLETREQHERNLTYAQSFLNTADDAMGDANSIILEARSIASSQIGIGSDTATRNAQASVVNQQISSLKDIANRQFRGVSVFGGGLTGPSGGDVFVDFLGGIRYIGSRGNLQGDLSLSDSFNISTNGNDAFGALSLRVQSTADLDPRATLATQLRDVGGVGNEGVRKGQLQVTVNGNTAIVDLADADTLGDVATRINDAISTLGAGAGTLGIAGNGFTLTANAGQTIAISEIGTGKTAASLGLAISASSGSTAGGDLNVKLSEGTTLASLGKVIDFTGGLKITQGNVTKVADLSSAQTIQDVINTVNALELGVRVEINASGTALNLVSEVSGLALSVGENAGGTTAGDLGLRTFGTDTALTDFNFGKGIHTDPAAADFAIALHNGTTVQVNIDGVTTVGELLTAIQTAAGTAGLTTGTPGTTGTQLNIGLASDGNGLLFEDQTAGAGAFAITNLNQSLAATDLGIATNAGAGGVIQGQDRAKVRTQSVFTNLMALRDALVADSTTGITFAGEDLQSDVDQIAGARASLGIRSKRLEDELERSEGRKIVEKSMLSEIRDADLTKVITRFTQLQQQLQASLSAGAQNLQLSLLDFLR